MNHKKHDGGGSSDTEAAFSALADPTRRALLERLSEGEATVGELAEPLQMSLPAVSKHLKILEQAGLLRRRRDGRQHIISIDAGPMSEVNEWISFYRHFWEDSFDRLAVYLEKESQGKKT